MFDMQSFLSGLALGLAGKPLALAREPVAYLYNGVRLPKLPEWDRVAYPYAVIAWSEVSDSYTLYQMTAPLTKVVRAENDPCLYVRPVETYPQYTVYTFTVQDGEWAAKTSTMIVKNPRTVTNEEDTPYFVVSIEHPVWSNYDIHNEDGTVYLAFSEPTPVYE